MLLANNHIALAEKVHGLEIGFSPEQVVTNWERRLAEANREILNRELEASEEPESMDGLEGLTQEVLAALCTEEEIISRREELEARGELRALKAALREGAQVLHVHCSL